MKPVFLLFPALILSLQAGDKPEPPVGVTKETVFQFYEKFPRLTKTAIWVDPLEFGLCRPTPPPSEEALAKAKRETGIHYQTSIHLYANPTAAAAIAAKQKNLPIGAVIVKEKLGDTGWDAKLPVPKTPVLGVGGMIKRAPGFDPKNGDWEYFYADETIPFTMGKMTSCSVCHAKARANDYLFSIRDLPR